MARLTHSMRQPIAATSSVVPPYTRLEDALFLEFTSSQQRQLSMKPSIKKKRRGFSLLELLAVVTILGIIAVVVIPRISVSSSTAKTNANNQNKSEINSTVERWYFNNGSWPAANLSDIGADNNYFPNGLPTNPVDGSAYTLSATTHRAN